MSTQSKYAPHVCPNRAEGLGVPKRHPAFSQPQKGNSMNTKKILASLLGVASLLATPLVRGDEIDDWNDTLIKAMKTGGTSPLVTTRVGAIVQSAVFDALNGIEGHYTSIHVPPNAAPGASRRAAVVQAAYATLLALYPAQQATLDQKRADSLNGIASSAATENSQSIARGIAWGQSVANQILAWRATDGFVPNAPAFLGGDAVGQWRPTPPAKLPGAAPQFAYMTPWVLNSPSQFRPPGPPAINTPQYTAEFNEVKTMGSINSTLRTEDESLYSVFWNSSTVGYFWNTVATRLANEKHLSFSKKAQLLAYVNLAMADAAIACWDAKYQYAFWRPITAIQLADTDGNADTAVDSSWTPYLVTPNHPDYPSGHSTVSGGATGVLAAYFGNDTPFWIDSDGLPGVVRVFATIDEARDEIANARIFAGIHFRTACEHGFTAGTTVANYILGNALQPAHGNK